MIARWIATAVVWLLTAGFVVAFIGETVMLFWEFGFQPGLTMATFAPQQFVFFPTLGVVAVLFFRDAAVLAVESAFSRITPAIAGLAVAVITVVGTGFMVGQFRGEGSDRSWWEVSLPALLEDHGGPICQPNDETCGERDTLSVISAHLRMGPAVREGLDLSEHVDTEQASTVLNDYLALSQLLPATTVYCVASGRLETVDACRTSQIELHHRINDLYAIEGNQSKLGRAHEYFLTAKTAFLFYIFGLGIFILSNHERMREVCGARIIPACKTLPVGALAMVIWPVLNQAYVMTNRAMFGIDRGTGYVEFAPIYVAFTIVWAASIMLFFLRLNRANAAMWTQVGTLSVTGLTVLQFDVIVRQANRIVGAGAEPAYLIAGVILIVFLSWQAAMIIRASGVTTTPEPSEEAYE